MHQKRIQSVMWHGLTDESNGSEVALVAQLDC